MGALINKLSRMNWLARTVKTVKLDLIVDALLNEMKPLRTSPEGARYRIDSIATAVVASEVFGGRAYRDLILEIRPNSIIDIGANVGLFTLLIDKCLKGKKSILAIEPNEKTVALLQSNLELNGTDAQVVIGAVGSRLNGTAALTVGRSHIAATICGSFNSNAGPTGRTATHQVPFINVLEQWNYSFGSRDIDLVKVDVEGAELDFLCTHTGLLNKTHNVVVEWHKWINSFESIDRALVTQNFTLVGILEEDHNAGVAWYQSNAT